MTLAGLALDEREMILDLISTLRDRLLTPEKILKLDESESFPLDIIEELLGPDIGLQLLFIPEEYGGMGGGARDIAVISEEMAKICLGVSTAFLAIHLGTDPILVGATEDQKQRWLTAIANGDVIVAYAVTEPEAGSNLANFKTTAEPVKDAAGNITAYRINGSKIYISNGKYADLLTVLAQTPEGPSFFVVEKDMDGFEAGKPEAKHGIRCSNTSPLTFDDVLVPVKNLVGGVPGKGLQQANEVFGYTRLMVAAFGLGAGVAALEKAIAYAKQRVQFGSTLIEKQGYTHKLIVPHVVRLEAARAYIEETAHRLDCGEQDLQVEGSIAKLFATEAGNACADDAIQALGGNGYMKEYEVEKIKRDVKITTIYEGTSEIQQAIISTYRWKNTVKTKGAYYGDMAAEMDAMHEEIADAGAHLVARVTRALNTTIQAVHKARGMRAQHVTFLLADTMAEVEVAVALMRKIKQLGESKKADRLKTIGRIFACDIMAAAHTRLNRIVFGHGLWDAETAADLSAELDLDVTQSQTGVIDDMDHLVTLS